MSSVKTEILDANFVLQPGVFQVIAELLYFSRGILHLLPVVIIASSLLEYKLVIRTCWQVVFYGWSDSINA
jgi:hypothetical protein